MAAAESSVLIKTARVPLSTQRAYTLFVRDIARWWPLETHKVSEGAVKECFFEDRAGGRIYEKDPAGEVNLWGTVLEASPPERVVFTWHPGRSPEEAQKVVLSFRAEGSETIVEVAHSGWEVLGDRAETVRSGYDTGWDFVLGERYVSAARVMSEN